VNSGCSSTKHTWYEKLHTVRYGDIEQEVLEVTYHAYFPSNDSACMHIGDSRNYKLIIVQFIDFSSLYSFILYSGIQSGVREYILGGT
jgi:hypothetical protein